MGITFTVGKITKTTDNFTEISTVNNSVVGIYKPCVCEIGQVVTVISKPNGTVLGVMKGII